MTEYEIRDMLAWNTWCKTDEGKACQKEYDEIFEAAFSANEEVKRMNAEHDKKFKAWLIR